MTVYIKDNAVSLDTALESLVTYSEAIDLIASHSRSVALEAIDISKVKDTVVRAFKAFWKRLVSLYESFVKWIKSKFGKKEMRDEVKDAKADVNDVSWSKSQKEAAERNKRYQDSKGNGMTTDVFIERINAQVTTALKTNAAAVLSGLETLASDDPKQKAIINKVIGYYRAFFICYGEGDGLINTDVIDSIASSIVSHLDGARTAFMQFIKLPAGADTAELTRKIETFNALKVFDTIASAFEPYVKDMSDESGLMRLHKALPQITKITETDFASITKVKKDTKLDKDLVSFHAERSNQILEKLLVTIDAYDEISNLIEEQASEFNKLRPEVILPGGTMEEVRPYIQTATAFSKVQTELTKLLMHKFKSEMALVNAVVALRDALRDNVLDGNADEPITFNIDFNDVILGRSIKNAIDKGDLKHVRIAIFMQMNDKKLSTLDIQKIIAFCMSKFDDLFEPFVENAYSQAIELDKTKWDIRGYHTAELYATMNFSKARLKNMIEIRRHVFGL